MENFRHAIKIVYKDKRYILLSVFVFLIIIFLYVLAIEYSASLETFFKANKPIYVISQVVFSLINAILFGISISFFVYSFVKKQSENNLNFIQSFVPGIVSIVTTGCYVCGNLLIPTLGLGVSFLTLPFGGLEIKVLSALFIAYTLRPLSKEVLGICEIRQFKTYSLKLNEISINFSFKKLYNLLPLATSLAFIAVIFALPLIANLFGFNKFIGANETYVCTEITTKNQS